ncbi:MAG: hypothetical protein ABEN55_10960, partial [Bradymonadaceae bacterium]
MALFDDDSPRADERDACGTGFVADRTGRHSHALVRDALRAICNLEHRGAVSSDGKTSDGTGLMTQLPVELFEDLYEDIDGDRLAVGMFFFPKDRDVRRASRERVDRELAGVDLEAVRWRDVPFDADVVGGQVRDGRPVVRQVLIH